jgi:hypothetical protein
MCCSSFFFPLLERSSLSHVTLHTLGEWELGRKKCKTSTVTTLLL